MFFFDVLLKRRRKVLEIVFFSSRRFWFRFIKFMMRLENESSCEVFLFFLGRENVSGFGFVFFKLFYFG